MRNKTLLSLRGVAMAVPFLFMFMSCEKTVKPMGSETASANSLPHVKRYSSSVANIWFLTLSDIIKTRAYFSSQTVRIYAYSGLALYESVLPGMPQQRSLLEGWTGVSIPYDKRKDYYWPAAANAAIARVSRKIMQAYPAPNLAKLNALEDSIRNSFADQASPEQLERSIDFGIAVADAIFEWSMKDGTFNSNGTTVPCPPFVLPSTPGSWQPTPPGFFTVAGACQGGLRTFIPDIVTRALPDLEVPYSTDPGSPFYQAAEEVYLRNTSITDDEKKQFENWRDISTNYSPLSHVVRIAANVFEKEHVNMEDAALLYVKMTLASHDAVNSVFYAKFKYFLMRPVTYIRSTLNRTTWLSLPVTPQTPSFPDEMAPTAASVEVLEGFFGDSYAFTDSTNKPQGGVWQYGSFDAMLSDIVEARLSGGTNFRFSLDAGIRQGRMIGKEMNTLLFQMKR